MRLYNNTEVTCVKTMQLLKYQIKTTTLIFRLEQLSKQLNYFYYRSEDTLARQMLTER